MIGRGGELGSGISVLMARQDDDDVVNKPKSLYRVGQNDLTLL